MRRRIDSKSGRRRKEKTVVGFEEREVNRRREGAGVAQEDRDEPERRYVEEKGDGTGR